jgi:hypothetical protein
LNQFLKIRRFCIGPTHSIRCSSPGKSPSSCKPRSSLSSTAHSTSVNSSAYQINIPKAGNPSVARWWAAHFIYFQHHTENNETPSPTNPSVSSTTTDYVVYEGEMIVGRNLQNGRGFVYIITVHYMKADGKITRSMDLVCFSQGMGSG